MSYQLVFDATTAHYPFWQLFLPLGTVAAVGLALVRWPRLSGHPTGLTRLFGVLLVLFGCGGALFVWRGSREQRSRVVGALQAGRYQQVEGRVEHFRPGGPDSHPPEEFDVAGHHYRYAPAEWLYGFKRVAAAGGPVGEGVQVRIADVDGLIARLEIAR